MKNADRGIRAIVMTPTGRGAVAVVVVEGDHAAEFVGNWFRPAIGRDLAQRSLGRIVYGRWGSDGHAGEDIVASRKGETLVEIHSHGGAAAVRRILDDLTGGGVEVLSWQTWRRSHDDDLIAAEADIALAQATTERTAGILLDQRQGALRREVERAIKKVNDEQYEAATANIAELLKRSRIGMRLTEPWRIVLAGPPNVGKSSLINALLGYERAIVFDQPGTTRDVVTATTAFDGWPCELSDTAGLRGTPADELEVAGIERARAQIARADLVILVEAADCAERIQDIELFNPQALIRVRNKSDLTALAVVGDAETISTSVKTGEGIGRLAGAITDRLIGEPPARGAAMPFTERQVNLLERAAMALGDGNGQQAAAALSEILRVSGG